MTITLIWTPTGAVTASNFVLAASPAPIPITNFRDNGGRLIQEATFFRGTARQFFDRGNRKTEFTFETSRQWASLSEAETFLFDHDSKFPGQFLATFVTGPNGSSNNTIRYLQNAVVESFGSSLKGCTTHHSYKISGGIISQTSPT